MRRGLPLLSAIFGMAVLLVLFCWVKADIYGVTGDEPHYLVMANGIAKYHTFEQTKAYKEEFETRKIYPGGLAPSDAMPQPSNTHAIAGAHGLYNVHNIGLPVLLAIPFFLGGVMGAKLFMLLASLSLVLLLWSFLSGICRSDYQRFLVILPIVLASPFIPAATQIYSDIIAGAISVLGVVWVLKPIAARSRVGDFWVAGLMAILPWLQIKFSITSVILVLAIAYTAYLHGRGAVRVIPAFILPALSCIALAFYNYYAFGKISGPYVDGAVEVSKTALMVLVGLHLDQNQGFLILSPILLAGLIGVGLLYRVNRFATFVWGLVYITLIVPNSLHPNWYGGWSMSGRFGWAAAVVFMLPTALALSRMYERHRNAFFGVMVLSLILQIYFLKLYAFKGESIYNRGAVTWPDVYSIFYGNIHGWLPMLYNSNWAYNYYPNYAWLGLALSLLAAGFIKEQLRGKVVTAVLTVGLAIIIAAGFLPRPNIEEATFSAAELPGQVGKVEVGGRHAVADRDRAGLLSYGPYFPLRAGRYSAVFTVSSSASADQIVGWLDVYNASASQQVRSRPLNGTAGNYISLELEFEVQKKKPRLYEFRSFWNGDSDLAIQSIDLKRVD